MSNAVFGSIGIAAYLALFACVGFGFVFVNLLIGRFLRPANPHEEKLEIYECGEPTIGSSFVQFDLRFYVVALIFIIFDVEVAFLFPWATVFGKASELAEVRPPAAAVATDTTGSAVVPLLKSKGSSFESSTLGTYKELGIHHPTLPARGAESVRMGGETLLWLATVEFLVFFAILIIAFAYEWKIGALDWVRAVMDEHKKAPRVDASPSDRLPEPVSSA